MPAATTGISSGMGKPIPASTRRLKAVSIGQSRSHTVGPLPRNAPARPATTKATVDERLSLPSVRDHYGTTTQAGKEERPRAEDGAGQAPEPRTQSEHATTNGRGRHPMKLGLINSAWAQAGKDTAFGIRMTREIGFDTIDIFADPLDLDIKERRLISRECERADLPIISVACVAVGLIDFNPSVQRFHLQRCRAYLDLAYEYRARNLLLVLGEYIW